MRKMLYGCAIAALVSLSTTATTAQEPANQTTYFTFSAPFELPGGKTLPAGKYTFRVADSPSNRHVVQVMSEKGDQIFATILAIPAQRQDVPEEPEVRFMEAPANQPPAIRTWWYPGRSIGHEFIYPKDHARRLAANQKEGVLTVEGDATSDDAMKTADLTRIDASGKETGLDTQRSETRTAQAAPPPQPAPMPQRTAPAPAPEPAPRAERRQAPTPEQAPARTTEPRTELPRTASLVPLIGLVGFASFAGAAFLRRRR